MKCHLVENIMTLIFVLIKILVVIKIIRDTQAIFIVSFVKYSVQITDNNIFVNHGIVVI